MDCQFISIYGKFGTSQTASFSRADISLYQINVSRHYARLTVKTGGFLITKWQKPHVKTDCFLGISDL